MTLDADAPEPLPPDPKILLGAHMSIAGGPAEAIRRGESVGCTVVQLFLKNSNQWKGKALTDEQATDFRETLEKSCVRAVFGHDSYLINLASPKPELFEKSLEAIVDEIRRAGRLGVPFIVMHPGSATDGDEEAGLRRFADGVKRAFDATADVAVGLSFEVTAGQGTNLGRRFEHLRAILDDVACPERTGVCLDTCHMFAAGYDLRDRAAFLATMRELDEIVGIERVQAVHLNDAKKGLGSRVDRHAHVGEGEIGLEGFRCIMNYGRFKNVPKCLETPKGPDLTEDVANLRILRGLVR